jgi:Flp pilus assembly protein TadG
MRLKAKRRRASAAVELAVSMIPLSFVVMGIVEGGRLMWVEELTANAAREGARLAVLGGSTIGTNSSSGSTEVNYRVRSYLTASGISTASATVTVTDLDNAAISDLTSASAGDRIKVSVSLPFSSVALGTTWYFTNATISASSVMRKEAP